MMWLSRARWSIAPSHSRCSHPVLLSSSLVRAGTAMEPRARSNGKKGPLPVSGQWAGDHADTMASSDGNCDGRGRVDRAGAVTTYVLQDNDYVRALLVAMIDEAEGFVVVGSSGSASDALAAIVRLQPQVAVVDGDLREGDGLL